MTKTRPIDKVIEWLFRQKVPAFYAGKTEKVITRELNVEKWQVEAAVKLIDEGYTIPFISRYRKEATGSLNDEQLRNLFERLTYLRNLRR